MTDDRDRVLTHEETFLLLTGMSQQSWREKWDRFHAMWNLVLAANSKDIKSSEKKAGMSQSAAIDHFIEETSWSSLLPEWVGGRGSLQERRAALITAHDHSKKVMLANLKF